MVAFGLHGGLRVRLVLPYWRCGSYDTVWELHADFQAVAIAQFAAGEDDGLPIFDRRIATPSRHGGFELIHWKRGGQVDSDGRVLDGIAARAFNCVPPELIAGVINA